MNVQHERSAVGGARHGCLRHWPTSISPAADGMDKGISPEDGRPVAKYGGKPLIAGNSTLRPLALEGTEPPLGVVILEFPTVEQAQRWHDDPAYAPLKQLRQANVEMEV